jgi:Icc-related predicted phosphoesterase
MDILAVSDAQVKSLETMIVGAKSKLKSIEMIVSCGDLDRDYIEFLVDGLNQELFFVSGNHLGCLEKDEFSDESFYENVWGKERLFREKQTIRIAGKKDLHGRVVAFKNYYIAGFGGSKWYSGWGNEFRESEMAKIVRSVIRKIVLLRLSDKLLKRPAREIIVVSHAPVSGIHDMSDACHSGFECFKKALKELSPVLWLHGHVHLNDNSKNSATVVGKTTVVNVYGYKFIRLSKDRMEISNKTSILDQPKTAS